MARSFTSDQLALLEGGQLKARLLVTIILDSGTYYFCDDVYDLSDGTITYIGASALISATDITSGNALSSEGCTLVIDGTRLTQTGFTDPAGLFRSILGEKYQGRRVNLALGLAPIDSQNITLIVPLYAGMVNNIKIVEDAIDFLNGSSSGTDPASVQPSQPQMIITLDSIARRYQRATFRTRSHNDHLQLWGGTDLFYSFVDSVVQNEKILYWGGRPPPSVPGQGVPYGGTSGTASYNLNVHKA